MQTYRDATTRALNALGDPTRRTVLELLRGGPMAVGDLAALLPVSRPAVSQHLRVLKDAGLVRDTRHGTRRLYAVAPEGLLALRSYVEGFWETALEAFGEAARTAAERRDEGRQAMDELGPIHKSVEVPIGPEEAFRLFTDEMGTWWPVETHSRANSEHDGVTVERVEFQGRVGGRVLEHLSNGQALPWAEVLAWDPPGSFALSWHPSSASRPPTEVEVRFTPTAGGTRVDLEHRGWERLGDEAVELRGGYQTGWDPTLVRFVDAATTRSLAAGR